VRALLRNTWIAVFVAFIAVVASGAAIVRSFARHVWVECRGQLVTIPVDEITGDLQPVFIHDFAVEYDVTPPGKKTEFSNVRVVWKRGDDACACSDVAVPWRNDDPFTSPSILSFYRAPSGAWVVQKGSRTEVAFETVESRGRRFVPARLADPQNVSMLVFLLSVGALGVAASGALRASPYVKRMSSWRAATLRPDGLVESESGATLGTMEPRSRLSPGPVIVDPAAFEGRDVYRSMPVLTRRNVGAGSHEIWQRGTMRRLRDARALAVVAVATNVVAVIAHVIGG
jgi:hypothetical protein